MDNPAQILFPLSLGIGLAAATGFRIFIPLLMLGIGVRLGQVPVSDGFVWVGTTPALLMLAVAAFTEVAAYYVPLLDNALDHAAGPTAMAAGILVSAAVLGNLDPMLKWTLAIIAGGGAAAATQSTTTALRGSSTLLTGGLGNHALATGEIVGAVVTSLLAMLLPYVTAILVLLFIWLGWRLALKWRRRTKTAT